MKEKGENDEQRLKDHVSGENRGGKPDLPGHAGFDPQHGRVDQNEQQKNGNGIQIETAQDIARDLGSSALYECKANHDQKKGKRLQESLRDVPATVGASVLCESVTPETFPDLFRMLDDMIAQLKTQL